MGPSFWTRDDEVLAKAAANGDLRCVACGLPVTITDPFAESKMVWLNSVRWVEDGVPKARCGACA